MPVLVQPMQWYIRNHRESYVLRYPPILKRSVQVIRMMHRAFLNCSWRWDVKHPPVLTFLRLPSSAPGTAYFYAGTISQRLRYIPGRIPGQQMLPKKYIVTADFRAGYTRKQDVCRMLHIHFINLYILKNKYKISTIMIFSVWVSIF